MIARERWPEVDALLLRVLELPPKEAERLLEAECDEDPDLYAHVKLLLSTEQSVNFLTEGISFSSENSQRLLELLDQACSSNTDPVKGQILGSYTIEHELGRGGMAVVYAASRIDSEIKQEVAIKLLLHTQNSKQIIQRFNQEKRILASLNHSGISRFLNHGISKDGRPFYVMEQINGQPINEYCWRHNLLLYPILRLWLSVAEAVSYAHQHLLVHRDLKPSNILVAENGEVKLLDFGIAKIIQPQDCDTLDLTQTGLRPMTLRYASPEQISEQPITTGTDIYQLGVLLYELLTGQLPYQVKGGSHIEWEDAIRHQHPAKPSQSLQHVLSSKEANTKAIIIPNVKVGELSGDLDAIILKALSKETEMRYGSVETMSEDIKRYMAGLPIKARPARFLYQTRRFLQRHRAVVITAALATILLLSLLVFDNQRLAKERDRALLEANTAEQVTKFLTAIFRGGNPELSGKSDLSARELLDQGASRIDAELSDLPEVKIRVQTEIGQAYRALGEYQQATEVIQNSLLTVNSVYGEDSIESAKSLARLARLYIDMGHYDLAEENYLTALEIFKLHNNELETAKILNNLALVLKLKGRFVEAKTYFEQATAIKLKNLGPDDPIVANSMMNLAFMHSILGEFDSSIELSNEAIRIYQAAGSTYDSRLANALNDRGLAFKRAEHLDRAKADLEKALDLKLNTYGPDHPRVANSLGAIGEIYFSNKDFINAEKYHKRSLEIYNNSYNHDHPYLATPMVNLARLSMVSSDYSTAIELLTAALKIRLQKFAPEHPKVTRIQVLLAEIYYENNDFDQAQKQLSKAIESLKKYEYLIDVNKLLSQALFLKAHILIDTFRYSEAEPLLHQSVEIRRQILGPDHELTIEASQALQRCLSLLNTN